MIRPGVCSVTLRNKSAEEVIELSVSARLQGIEWGADVHALPGDGASARRVGRLTREAGLEVAGYGSYFLAHERAGEAHQDFAPVLETARELGAPVIRIWAGSLVMEKTEAYFAAVVEHIRAAAELAAAEDIKVACEFHRNTFTETAEGALRLLQAVAHPNLYSYWQPPHGSGLEQRLGEIGALKERLLWVHVFHWQGAERPPFPRRELSEGIDLWQPCLDAIAGLDGDRYALLEFARDDSVAQFLKDARTLHEMIHRADSGQRQRIRPGARAAGISPVA